MSDDPEMIQTGMNVPADVVDELDDIKREWDDWESSSISRSEVIREALAVGVVVLEELDEELGPESRRFATQERRAMARQALLDHLDEADDP